MIKKAFTLVILLLLCVYLVAAFTVLNRKPQGAVCEGVEYFMQDSLRSAFITTTEIESMLKKNRLYPKGELMDSIVCRNIEGCLQEDSRVELAECYKSPSNRVCIKITQRVPILRVMSNSGENYFVDTKGEVMPQNHCAAYLPIVTGSVDKKMACTDLYALGQFLQKDKFWNAQILQINVTSEKELELVPRVGSHVIFLGKPEQFEQKLAKLKEFYEKALNKVGWNKYSRINVEFNNQVICTKKEK